MEKALKEYGDLSVIVCDREGQKISGKMRAQWIKEMVPGAKVKIAPDFLPEDDSAGWAAYTKWLLHGTPDAVFTSEDYGEPYSKYLGCRHVMVDRERKTIPISGTKIRQNPLANWEFLPPPVRARFAKRVCILGAESTGTTTLAKSLAEHYKTSWVQEFGRAYSEAKINSPESSAWRTEEFIFIARTQNKIEDALVKTCNKILVCDTNSFATSLWHERYMGFISPEVEAASAGRECDLYILTGDEIPFVQDGTRDGGRIRHTMHRRFEEELEKKRKKFIIVRGPHEIRMEKAIGACNSVLKDNFLTEI